jgi:hypothetical protein
MVSPCAGITVDWTPGNTRTFIPQIHRIRELNEREYINDIETASVISVMIL